MTFLIAPRFVGPCCPCTYLIENSVYGDGSTGYFSHTPGSASGNSQFWISVNLKLGKIGGQQEICSAYGGGTGLYIRLQPTGELQIQNFAGTVYRKSNRLFRDPGAFGILFISFDGSTSIDAWWNGEPITWSTTGSLPASYDWNNNVLHRIMCPAHASSDLWTGYMAEFVSVSGVTGTPDLTGATDASGNWVPIDVSGLTFGTNGFLLDFSNGADLGEDSSGNGNDWTTNGTITQTTDSPTDDAAGDIGNFCTLNPLEPGGGTCSGGNLAVSLATFDQQGFGSIPMPSGKWYWEAVSTGGTQVYAGICDSRVVRGSDPFSSAYIWGYRDDTGAIRHNGSNSPYGASYTTEVIGVAYDADVGKLYFSKGGTWQNGADPAAGTGAFTTGIVAGAGYLPWVGNQVAFVRSWAMNFGQTPFANTPPTGFKPLCTANLPAPTVANGALHHDVHLRTGTGASATITGIEFQPDLVWTKSRSNTTNHNLFDAVRGVQKGLVANSTAGEYTDANTLTAFTSDGYTYGSDSTPRGVNTNTHTYVDWLWKAGGAGSSNSDGSITCTLSVDQTAGISISTFSHPSGTGTVGHGLGAAPQCIITKSLASGSWIVAHVGLTNMSDRYVALDSLNAEATDSTYWNNTAPTSSVWSIGSGLAGSSRIAYCFAEVPGFSKFGNYVGNGSADGPFIWCGFRPRFVLIKNKTTGVTAWLLYDTARSPFNSVDVVLFPQDNGAEAFDADMLDILSNGFKLRDTPQNRNQNGDTYIYLAFAEHPFGGVGVSQARAR